MTDSSNPYQSPNEETPPPAPSPEKSWAWPLVMVGALAAAGISLTFAPGLFIALVIMTIPVILRTQWLVKRKLNDGEGPDFWTTCGWAIRSAWIVMTITFAAGVAFAVTCGLTASVMQFRNSATEVAPFLFGAIVGAIVTVMVTREVWDGGKPRDLRSMWLARHRPIDDDNDD